MKIYINRKPVLGPWGGGNKTVTELCDKLAKDGHDVVHDLNLENIDLIFCVDPRPNEYGHWYQDFINYKMKHDTPIVQRVGDVGTHGKPELTNLVKQSVNYSDYVIFPSDWARKKIGCDLNKSKIIHNAPLSIFHNFKKHNKLEDKNIKIVTHHWSTNPKKGFNYYKELDKYISLNSEMSFTYIGRLPDNYTLQNSNYCSPTGDNELISKKLSDSDIYLTASEEEAGANHVLEGMASGLPVVYHNNGGSIPEYCKDYGIGFESPQEMIESIKTMKNCYDKHKKEVLNYNDDISKVVEKYVDVICNIV